MLRMILAAVLPAVVLGGSRDFNEAVAMTAMSRIEGKALAQLKRLLNNKDAVDVSFWGERVAEKFPEVKKYFVTTLPMEGAVGHDGNSCYTAGQNDLGAQKDGHIFMLKHFFLRLLGEIDAWKEFNTEYPDDFDFTDADSLRFVIGLTAALHQPTAYIINGDNSAEDLVGELIWRTQTGENEKIQATGFDMLDNKICKAFAEGNSVYWNGGWTHAHHAGSKLLADAQKQFGENTEQHLAAIDRWAQEVADGKCKRQANLGKTNFSWKSSQLTNYFQAFLKRDVLAAGIHMSVILDKILAVKSALKLRKGSSVSIKDEVLYDGAVLLPEAQVTAHFALITFGLLGVIMFLGWLVLVREPNADNDQTKNGPYGVNAAKRSVE